MSKNKYTLKDKLEADMQFEPNTNIDKILESIHMRIIILREDLEVLHHDKAVYEYPNDAALEEVEDSIYRKEVEKKVLESLLGVFLFHDGRLYE